MKFSYILTFSLGAILWAVVVMWQLLVPLLIVLMFMQPEAAAFGALAIVVLIAVGLTLGLGGINSVPSIIWRARKTLNTRIVEVEGKYALQLQVLGRWIYVEAKDGHVVTTSWNPDLSAHTYLLPSKSSAREQLKVLEKEIQEGLKEPASPEVLSSHSIVNGKRVT